MNLSLQRAAERISNGAYTRYGMNIIFVTPAGNVEGRYVIEFTSSSQFAKKFTTDYTVQTLVNMYDYRYKIFPHRDNLKAIVQIIPMDTAADRYLTSRPTFQETYRCLLIDNDDTAANGGSPITSKREADPRDEEFVFRAQLVEIPSERISYKQGGGLFTYSKTEEVLKGFLQSQVDAESANNPDMGKVDISMVPIDPLVPERDSIIIPHDKYLVDVPGYIQEHQGGLYTKAVGSFILRNKWFIFPVFDTERFVKSTKRLKIIQLDGLKAPISDRTFTVDGGEITVLCTTSGKMQDLSVSGQINDGTGTRFLKATEMFENTSVGDPNKEAFNREGVSADFQVGKRADGNNIAKYSDNLITDNIVNEYSKIAFRKGQLFITIWQRSLARLVEPGMPMRLYYDKGGKTVVYDGTVIQIDEQWTSEAKGLVSKSMISTAAIVCFIDKEEAR